MREEALKQFFTRSLSASQLAAEASASIKKLGHITESIEIEDMASNYVISRAEVLSLCDAAEREELSAEAVVAIAFMLLVSDRFEWDSDDEVIPEVLNDWSCPEVNYPLIPVTFQMHHRWLSGEEAIPEKLQSKDVTRGKLISVRWKCPINHQ
jgi:hypothetical protein